MDIVQQRDEKHPGDFGCALAGCSLCLEKLLQKHTGLIRLIIRRQCPRQADYADLIQAGRLICGCLPITHSPTAGCRSATAVL